MSANPFLIENFVSVSGIEIKKESQITILFRYIVLRVSLIEKLEETILVKNK